MEGLIILLQHFRYILPSFTLFLEALNSADATTVAKNSPKGQSVFSLLTHFKTGQLLWRSWQSGCVRYQRTQVRIQSSATFFEHLFFLLTVCRKDENKEQEAGNGPFLHISKLLYLKHRTIEIICTV